MYIILLAFINMIDHLLVRCTNVPSTLAPPTTRRFRRATAPAARPRCTLPRSTPAILGDVRPTMSKGKHDTGISINFVGLYTVVNNG